MDADKYNRSISLQCSTCGGTDFAYQPTDGEVQQMQCAGCKREFTREELIAENGENISAHVDEIKGQVANDFAKELRDQLRRSFSGSKYIKIK